MISCPVVIFLFGGLYLKEAGVSENLLDQCPHGDMSISGAGEEGEVSLNIILKMFRSFTKDLTTSS